MIGAFEKVATPCPRIITISHIYSFVKLFILIFEKFF